MNTITSTLPRLRWSYDNAEALKWIAFACMIVDHANKLFAGGQWEWAVPIGRVAFPLFAFVIGRHLGDPSTSSRLLKRLLLVGAVTTPVYLVTMGFGQLLPLNILFTFALSLGVWHLVRMEEWLFALGVFALGVWLVDYHMAGVALVLACAASWQWPKDETYWIMSGPLFLLCLLNGNVWALLAIPVALAAALFDWRVPRIRWFFWIAYPAHLAVLALLLAFGV